ncbi:MAG: hypothetical protein ABSD78_18445 [Acidimicrobiales bacterium]|jgi:hypothetical protein
MSTYPDDDIFPEEVVIDGYILDDVCWLLNAVEEFARFGDVEAVVELLRFADDRLSPDGLANVAGEFASRVRRKIQAAR